MTVFLARQPILDANLNVFGYELFYRSGFTNHYTGVNADEASTEVIVDTFQNLGLSSLTDGKPAFINFSTALLQREIATLFPAENLVIEILETVVADENTVQNCRRLKEAGYKLALDDFAFQENLMPLLDLADIIKIDLQAVEGNALVKFSQPLKDKRYTLRKRSKPGSVPPYTGYRFPPLSGLLLQQAGNCHSEKTRSSPNQLP